MYKLSEDLAQLGKKRIEGCPVEGFVYGSGPLKPVFMMVGEAPGETEVHSGIPFTGRAGKELMNSLASIGLSREDVYITSAVRSRPYKWQEKKQRNGQLTQKKYNRAPTKKEIIAHAPLLDAEIQDVHPPLIVTLGNIGLQRLVGPKAKVTELHGTLMETPILQWDEGAGTFVQTPDVYYVFPTFHPASVFYNPPVRELVQEDWRKLRSLLKGTV